MITGLLTNPYLSALGAAIALSVAAYAAWVKLTEPEPIPEWIAIHEPPQNVRLIEVEPRWPYDYELEEA